MLSGQHLVEALRRRAGDYDAQDLDPPAPYLRLVCRVLKYDTPVGIRQLAAGDAQMAQSTVQALSLLDFGRLFLTGVMWCLFPVPHSLLHAWRGWMSNTVSVTGGSRTVIVPFSFGFYCACCTHHTSPPLTEDVKQESNRAVRLALAVRKAGYDRGAKAVCGFFVCVGCGMGLRF